MTMKAVALVKISPVSLREALRPAGGGDLPELVDRGSGLTFRLKDLEDGTLVKLSTGFDAEPYEIAAALNKALGGVARLHRDARGILVFPDRAMPEARRYDGVVEEIGELGEWVSLSAQPPKPAPKPAAPPPAAKPTQQPATQAGFGGAGMPDLGGLDFGALAAQMQSMMSTLPPEALAQMQQSVMSGDPAQMQAMESQLQAMLGADRLAALQEQVLGAFAGGGGLNPNGAPGELPDPSQMEAMLAQAQEQVEALKQSNPALYEQLKKQAESAASDDDDARPTDPLPKK